MYARSQGDRELTFDFAEGLIKDNLLFVDRETRSIWSQLHGKAVSGPLKEQPLQMIPAVQSTWGFWRSQHPTTEVMVVENEEGHPYLYRDRQNHRNRRAGQSRPKERPNTHDTSALGLGMSVGGKALFFPFSELEKASIPLQMKAGGKDFTVHYDRQGMTAWAEDEQGTLMGAVLAYRYGWMDFHPDSEIYQAE